MELEKRKILLKTFMISQFSYCPPNLDVSQLDAELSDHRDTRKSSKISVSE